MLNLLMLVIPSLLLASPHSAASSNLDDTCINRVPQPVPGKVSVHNRCMYDVWIRVLGIPEGNGPFQIRRGQKYEGSIYPATSGISLQVAADMGSTVQFQYKAIPEFDFSYYAIDFRSCLKDRNASDCPGWQYGVRAFCGTHESVACGPGEYCTKVAYFNDKTEYPAHSCRNVKDKGMVFELCWINE